MLEKEHVWNREHPSWTECGLCFWLYTCWVYTFKIRTAHLLLIVWARCFRLIPRHFRSLPIDSRETYCIPEQYQFCWFYQLISVPWSQWSQSVHVDLMMPGIKAARLHHLYAYHKDNSWWPAARRINGGWRGRNMELIIASKTASLICLVFYRALGDRGMLLQESYSNCIHISPFTRVFFKLYSYLQSEYSL